MILKNKIPVYCAFSGTGKTHYCKTHVGGVDIDEEPYLLCKVSSNLILKVIYTYHKNGYRILTNASPYVLKALYSRPDLFEVNLIVPDETMKKEIIQRIETRGDIKGAKQVCKIYDKGYDYLSRCAFTTKYILHTGEYVEDALKTLD